MPCNPVVAGQRSAGLCETVDCGSRSWHILRSTNGLIASLISSDHWSRPPPDRAGVDNSAGDLKPFW
ncbi:hypothetical protein J6590_096868, partial [Homalodisca vitripennis]